MGPVSKEESKPKNRMKQGRGKAGTCALEGGGVEVAGVLCFILRNAVAGDIIPKEGVGNREGIAQPEGKERRGDVWEK